MEALHLFYSQGFTELRIEEGGKACRATAGYSLGRLGSHGERRDCVFAFQTRANP